MYCNVKTIGLIVALAMSTGANAAVFCVGSASALQNALDTAATNAHDNTIKVRSGTYHAPDGGFTYWRQSGNFHLDVEGGWNAGCMEQTQDASLTVLDGASQHAIINFAVFDTHSGTGVTLRYFDLYHGVDQRGFSPIEIDSVAGNTRVENNRIRYNRSRDDFAEVVQVGKYGAGNVYFLDNVVAENDGQAQSSLMKFAVEGSGQLYFNNNTVTDNIFATLAPLDGALWFMHASLANNILWGNAGAPEIATQYAPLLIDNDIDVSTVTPAAGSIGNISADPRFASPTDRHLRAGSPACDAGDDTPPGTTRSIDLAGNPRRVRTVDMGAYERQGTCN
jgi:hypothetical protein